MAIKMLLFDFRESEKEFFKTYDSEIFDITFFKESLNDETVKNLTSEQLEQTYAISVFIDSEVTQNVINSFKNLRIISTRSTGIDHINHKAAVEKNIDIINVENYGAKSVAQYTMGLMIALVRNILPASNYLLKKDRQCSSYIGRDISKLTLGVVGTGAIGAGLCKLAVAFGMNVLAYDINKKRELENLLDVKYTNIEELLSHSDIVSLHLPYTGDNYHMFSQKQFALMKNCSYFINTSRGELVDIFALDEAIRNKKIKGAALDVVTCEEAAFKCNQFSKKLKTDLKCMKEVEIINKLAQFPNVIITPHIAYETQDAVNYLLEMSFRGILDSIKGGSTYKMF